MARELLPHRWKAARAGRPSSAGPTPSRMQNRPSRPPHRAIAAVRRLRAEPCGPKGEARRRVAHAEHAIRRGRIVLPRPSWASPRSCVDRSRMVAPPGPVRRRWPPLQPMPELTPPMGCCARRKVCQGDLSRRQFATVEGCVSTPRTIMGRARRPPDVPTGCRHTVAWILVFRRAAWTRSSSWPPLGPRGAAPCRN